MVKLLRDRGWRGTAVTRRKVLSMGALAASGGLPTSLRARAKAGAPQETTARALLVRRGMLVTADGRWEADLRTRGGKNDK